MKCTFRKEYYEIVTAYNWLYFYVVTLPVLIKMKKKKRKEKQSKEKLNYLNVTCKEIRKRNSNYCNKNKFFSELSFEIPGSFELFLWE